MSKSTKLYSIPITIDPSIIDPSIGDPKTIQDIIQRYITWNVLNMQLQKVYFLGESQINANSQTSFLSNAFNYDSNSPTIGEIRGAGGSSLFLRGSGGYTYAELQPTDNERKVYERIIRYLGDLSTNQSLAKTIFNISRKNNVNAGIQYSELSFDFLDGNTSA
jgi:hypothetical protein